MKQLSSVKRVQPLMPFTTSPPATIGPLTLVKPSAGSATWCSHAIAPVRASSATSAASLVDRNILSP